MPIYDKLVICPLRFILPGNLFPGSLYPGQFTAKPTIQACELCVVNKWLIELSEVSSFALF